MGGFYIEETELFVIEDGQRRRAAYYTCAECGQQFLAKIRSAAKKPPKYCSMTCNGRSVGKMKRKRTPPHKRVLVAEQDYVCGVCGKTYRCKPYRNRSEKTSVLVCSKECRWAVMRPENGFRGDQLSKSHYSGPAARIKEWVCTTCGEIERMLLQIHHVDGNRDNNPVDGSNWEVVCANCHKLRHLIQKLDGSWRYKSAALTPRDQIPIIYRQILERRQKSADGGSGSHTTTPEPSTSGKPDVDQASRLEAKENPGKPSSLPG